MSDGQRILRNVLHLSTGVVAIAVLNWPRDATVILLAGALAGSLALDLARRHAAARTAMDRLLPRVYRPDEFLGISGATWLAAGYLLAVAFLPATAAAAGILALAVGDPAAAVVGGRFGRWWAPAGARKTWIGSLACFVAAGLALWALPYLGPAAAVAGGAMTALVERRARQLDNLLIPVAVAMLVNLWIP